MAFLTKFFTCCQSSKNIEAEKDHLEFRLSSPRFPQTAAAPAEVINNFAQPVQERLVENCQNDHTFNQADDSENGEAKQGESISVYHMNNMSFEILRDPIVDPTPKENNGKDSQTHDDGSNKVVIAIHEESTWTNSPKFQVEEKKSFPNKEFKTFQTLKQEDSGLVKKKSLFGADMESDQMIHKEEENNSKAKNHHMYRRNITREALNSSPRIISKNI